MYPNFVAFGAQPITKVPLVRQYNEALSAGERFLLNANIIMGHSLYRVRDRCFNETVFQNM